MEATKTKKGKSQGMMASKRPRDSGVGRSSRSGAGIEIMGGSSSSDEWRKQDKSGNGGGERVVLLE